MVKTLYFTKKGLKMYQEKIDSIQNELDQLQFRIADVSEHGGNQWHDNASYDYVTAEIRQNDRLLKDMIAILRMGVVISESRSIERVDIGTKVKVLWNGENHEWCIGGYGESDIDNGIIAYNTPLADLIMGKKVGETGIGEIARKKVAVSVLEINIF